MLALLKVGLENRIRVLRLQDIEVSCEALEVFTESLVGYDLIELLIIGLERVSLAAEHES